MKRLILLALCTVLLAACSPTPLTEPVPEGAPSATGNALEAMTMGSLSVTTATVSYSAGTDGFLAYPSEPGEYPGVVLIHEWWGLNDNIKETARVLASHGYQVLAVDLYGGKVATTADEARTLVGSVDQSAADQNLADAVTFLRERGALKVASWGYCFGGGQSATLAVSGKTDATVVYYGNLAAPLADPSKVTGPVLLVYGDQDTSTPLASAEELQRDLKGLGRDVTLLPYKDVGHAFANPSNPGHDPAKTRDAWEKTLAFLQQRLG